MTAATTPQPGFRIGDRVIVTLDRGTSSESIEPAVVTALPWPPFPSYEIRCDRDGFTLYVHPTYLEPALDAENEGAE